MGNFAYISIPVVNYDHFRKTVLDDLQRKYPALDYTYHNYGDIYDNFSVSKADVFIMYLPCGKWEYQRSALPPGCKKELQQAIVANRPLYIVYKNHEGVNQIYGAKVNGDYIEAIQGSAGAITHHPNYLKAKAERTTKRIDINKTPHFKNCCVEITLIDKRILLMRRKK